MRASAALRALFRTRPIAALDQSVEMPTLRRVLGPWDLTALGLGAVVGSGIFVVTGVAAATQAGPAVVLSFVVAALACFFSALCYAEIAAMVPVSGSTYTYAMVTMGELIAWIIGWDLILEYALSIAAVAIGWAAYFQSVLAEVGLGLPERLLNTPSAGGLVDLPAVLVMLAIGGVLALGARTSARANNVMVLIKLAVIGLFVAVGLSHVRPANWHPFLPFGWHGVIGGAGLIFFAFIGFDAVSTAAEEARNPERDMPLGILGALGLCTLLYVMVALVLTGMTPFAKLNVADPVAFALHGVGAHWIAAAVGVGAVVALTSVLLVTLYGQTRIFYAMARDGLLPDLFARVHPRLRTPTGAIAVSTIVVALTAGFVPIDAVVELANIGTLAAFVIVAAAVLILRRRQPAAKRPFRAPLIGITAPLAIVSCLALIATLQAATLWRFVIWLGAGLAVYALYAHRHAKRAAEKGQRP